MLKHIALIIALTSLALLGAKGAIAATPFGKGLKDYGQKEYVRVSKDLAPFREHSLEARLHDAL